MHPLFAQLTARGPAITDGAWGTQLQARGLAPGECPDVWNLTHPGAVESVARAYVEAGSDVILTNTFGANRIALGRHGLAGQAVEINRAGAAISRRAAAGRARVFASLGPSGSLVAAGEVAPDDLRAAFEEQARALADAGVDALLLETFADLDELRVALAAAKATGLPVVASLVFDSGPAKDRTMTGATPEQAARAAAEAGADAVGANCGRGIEGYIPIGPRLRAATTLPLWMKPNAGLPESIGGKTVYTTTPADFAARVPALVKAGAAFVGACCGSTPDFIRAIRRSDEFCETVCSQ